jgi:DNA-directed RNA polymerase specialized sigma24 family protein
MPRTDVDRLVELNDVRLEPLLRSTSAGDVDAEVERLIVSVARPLAQAILSRHARSRSELSQQDADDIASTIQLRLISKLRAVVASPEEAVQDFENYVASLTYNAVNDHLRRAFPARARLKNRLRYLLARDPRLGAWTAGGRMVAGLARWREARDPLPLERINPDTLPKAAFDSLRPGDALTRLFESTGNPLSLDDLVTLAARLWHVVDLPAIQAGTTTGSLDSSAEQLENREYLQALWREIQTLRPMQRRALLLNLRSSGPVNVASLFVLTGTATFDQVAATLDMSAEELVAIWNELPLEDTRIAALLGVTRQQVINLRKSARERLARRMARHT